MGKKLTEEERERRRELAKLKESNPDAMPENPPRLDIDDDEDAKE